MQLLPAPLCYPCPCYCRSYHGLPAWIEFPSLVKARICCLQLPTSHVVKRTQIIFQSQPCCGAWFQGWKYTKLTKASTLKSGNQSLIWLTPEVEVECSQGNHWIQWCVHAYKHLVSSQIHSISPDKSNHEHVSIITHAPNASIRPKCSLLWMTCLQQVC